MKLLFDGRRIKMREYREAMASNDTAAELMANHAVDEQGNRIDHDVAMAELDELTLEEFARAFKDLQESALPK